MAHVLLLAVERVSVCFFDGKILEVGNEVGDSSYIKYTESENVTS